MGKSFLTKNLFKVMVIFMFFISFIIFFYPIYSSAKLETPNNAQMINESVKLSEDKGKKHKLIRDTFFDSLKNEDIDEEEFFSEGSFYFTEDDEMVIQLLIEGRDENKSEKIKKISEALAQRDNRIQVQKIEYSEEELKIIIRNFEKENPMIPIIPNLELTLNVPSNRVDLIANELSPDNIELLKTKYGDKLFITIDPDFTVEEKMDAKSREADWNKLGAGIGISTEAGNCSTAGVAWKDIRYFIITAGHCLEDITTSEYVNQWASAVGHKHLDAQASDYDLGLVIIDETNTILGGREASRGLYKYGSSTGYDSYLTGAKRPYLNQPVCKTGITTGYTCGKVTDIYTREPFF